MAGQKRSLPPVETTHMQVDGAAGLEGFQNTIVQMLARMERKMDLNSSEVENRLNFLVARIAALETKNGIAAPPDPFPCLLYTSDAADDM
eukprot:3807551-Prorocentrum_lima.AAC.1